MLCLTIKASIKSPKKNDPSIITKYLLFSLKFISFANNSAFLYFKNFSFISFDFLGAKYLEFCFLPKSIFINSILFSYFSLLQ
jgi:hypothetical protein